VAVSGGRTKISGRNDDTVLMSRLSVCGIDSTRSVPEFPCHGTSDEDLGDSIIFKGKSPSLLDSVQVRM
jgi:hypothetical protein